MSGCGFVAAIKSALATQNARTITSAGIWLDSRFRVLPADVMVSPEMAAYNDNRALCWVQPNVMGD